MAPLHYKLSELELVKLENLKLREQLLAAHKEILSSKYGQLETERKLVTNQIITSRNVPGDGFDIVIDDIKGFLIAQPKLSKETSQQK